MSDVQDHSALKWIKGELDLSAESARRSLEAYVESDPVDEGAIDDCINRLHQIHGTLQMVQLYGAAMLAEEMEFVALALKEGSTRKRIEAAEAMMLGLVQLPEYLEKLEYGARDIPLLLLPILNELRAVRDAALLSEVALFAPELESRLALSGVDGAANPGLSETAHRLRIKYHKALLGWYRGSDAKDGIERIAGIFSQLADESGTTQVKRLFKVAQSVAVGIGEGSIDTGVATKLLLGKIDREIKKIIDHGELPAAEAPANDLLKNLLYYTACADSTDPLIQEIQTDFHLENSLLSQADLEEGREELHAPGQQLLESLRGAIETDLTAIKDSLDLFIRGKNTDLARLQSLEEPIRKLADTLGMVGQGGLRQRLQRQAERIAEVGVENAPLSDQDLMAMASDILFIETSLANLSVVRRHSIQSSKDQLLPDLPDGEFERLVDSVMHESRVDMARNKEAIIEFIESPENKTLLDKVPRRFKGIAGAFRILKLTDAAGLVDSLAGYVESEFLQKGAVPSFDALNAFADAVTGIEYFMEAVTEGRGIQPEILEVTREALEQLNVPAADESEVREVEYIEAAVTGELETVAHDEALETEALESVGVVEETPTPVELPPEEIASAEKPPMDDIDQEILDIFLEEAKEELEVIQEYLPRWRLDRSDQDAMATFRRSFHTLKGSGRLVGAKDIGEYAWSIENLLNRIIDETVEISPAILELLDETLKVLPVLVDAQETGQPPAVDVQPLIDRAFALTRPPEASVKETAIDVADNQEEVEPLVSEEAISTETPESEPEDDSLISADVLPFSLPDGEQEGDSATALDEPSVAIKMDETLLEIFSSESAAHIETLKQFHDACEKNPLDCRVGGELVRALHTLHGSADMAGVDSIADVSAALESLVGDLQHLGLPADQRMLDLVERSTHLFETVLKGINVAEFTLPEWQLLLDEINLYQAIPTVLAEVIETDISAEGSAEVIAPEPVESDYESELQAEVEAIDSAPVDAFQFDGVDHDGMSLFEPEMSETPKEDEVAGEPEAVIEPEAIEETKTVEEIEAVEETEAVEEIEAADEVEAAAEVETVELPSVVDETGEGEAITMVELDADEELVEIFLEEAQELQHDLEQSLQRWREDPANGGESVADLQRTLHTLKGGARLVGAMPIGDLSHALESLLTPTDQKQMLVDQDVLVLAQSAADCLAEQIEDLSRGPRVRAADDLITQLEQGLKHEPSQPKPVFVAKTEAPEKSKKKEGKKKKEEKESKAKREEKESKAKKEEEKEVNREGAEEQSEPAVVIHRTTTEQESFPVRREGREQVRVRSDLLDRLVNNAGEVSIYRARLEQQNSALGFNLTELEQTVDRLRGQLRQLEIETEAQILFRYENEKEQDDNESFDPLELDRFSSMQQVSRSLLETVNDLVSIHTFLDEQQKETETLLLQQSRVSTDLQDGLLRTRMVPFSQIAPRLRRVVRQTSKQLGKQAELHLHGIEGEIDRGILDRMVGPLEHLLRNAVSHGIEMPAQREQVGKAGSGSINLTLEREGNDILMTISDDGAGIRIDDIRHKAIESGLLDPHANVPDSDVLQFVLEHGFSTADKVTQIAGRGVGLDVVVSEVKQLGGSLDITSLPDKGASFIIRLPLTLAISDALLVELGDEIYAIPHTSIEGVVRVSRQELQECYSGRQTSYTYADHDYQVRYLGTMLGSDPLSLSEQRKWYPMLLVRAGEHRVALQVDGLLGNRQVVVKPVGLQIGSVRWIAGGTILGDGRVALILDVTALVRTDRAQAVIEPLAVVTDDLEPGVGKTVMVVDDSITVRKVTGRVLERNGMNVVAAKDGVDAVAMLQEHRPDIMLLDIEMPRMDGYEVARHMRNTEELKGIPIIMITSRTGDKHRNLAMELGVKRYLGKPFQESDLLENIYSVLSEVTDGKEK